MVSKDLLDQDYIDFYNDLTIRQIFRRKEKELMNIPSEPISNFMFTQTSNLKFRDVSKVGLDQKGFSNGSAYVDIDNDVI